MNFNKKDLYRNVLDEYYDVYRSMQDSEDFVPERTIRKIDKTLHRALCCSLKQANKEDKKFQRGEKRRIRKARPKRSGLLSKIFGRKKGGINGRKNDIQDVAQ